jgi:hypothetical protein
MRLLRWPHQHHLDLHQHPGAASPAIWNAERAGRFGCASVPKYFV